jgi:predicted unusual protein kinase regulating ubiquinone biosynthesis (AarF/ABC1/UbiB family)
VTRINTPQDTQGRKLDQRRYRRITRFFGMVILDIIWWEIALKRLIGTQGVARGRAERFRRYARGFRMLAVGMGGVMIKLGQFVSARVDVMPPEIIGELADLQDEVPPEKLGAILNVVEAEHGTSPNQLFEHFDTEVQAAASLGQVYRARLKSGERVVVKVQRPGIEDMVATDLEALRVVARWAMLWPLISKRADVPALLEEFARTLWEELDYCAEADNADRFRELFADDVGVYVPAVYREYSRRRVLTLEDVTSIKITDHAAIDAAGVDRKLAAQRLLDVYLRMIFDFGFFHADPHPGNLFVYPLSEQASEEMIGQSAAHDGQPFYIVFVDFGMVGRITDQVKQGLRETLIAVGTRDTKRLLKAYQMLGVLLPAADLSRIEEAEAAVLDYIWGKSVPELARMSHAEMHDFALKYRDLLYKMPFQVPQDFIYLARAVGILSGMCTSLDPEFNPWAPMATYAQKLVAQEARSNAGAWLQEAVALGQVVIGLPRQLQDVLDRTQRGNIEVQVSPAQGFQGGLRRLELALNGVARALVFASLLVSATWLYTSGQTLPGLIAFGLAGVAWLMLIVRRRNGNE